MGLVVNTNTQSLFAQRALRHNTLGLQRNIERLSTGYRINRAADDAAGLSISQKLTTRIRGFEKAKQNAADGISLLQTAEGSLGIIQENFQRIRELAIQGLNGTNSASEADAIQREINERLTNVDKIARATKFNDKRLIFGTTGAASDFVLQTGPDQGQTTTLNFRAGQTANTGIRIDINQIKMGTSADFGSLHEGITTSNFKVNRMHLGVSGMTVDSLDSPNNVTIDLDDVDTIISNISRMRSYIGAVQNSLESKMEYMDIAMENDSASRSRIQDVDVAKESSLLVRNQILQQSASAMLAQANAQPQIALQLIN